MDLQGEAFSIVKKYMWPLMLMKICTSKISPPEMIKYKSFTLSAPVGILHAYFYQVPSYSATFPRLKFTCYSIRLN